MAYEFKPIVFDHDPTEQEIFKAAVVHLVRQRVPSITGGECRYRMQDQDTGKTLACAVGAFYPESIEAVEGLVVRECLELFGDKLPSWMLERKSLLILLQYCHDEAALGSGGYLSSLKRGLTNVARDVGIVEQQFDALWYDALVKD